MIANYGRSGVEWFITLIRTATGSQASVFDELFICLVELGARFDIGFTHATFK